ncbi:MAG: PQQ-binding-like beta-propeller repeat protein [Planctomycetaceae bacterium]|jgi:outer membrane protein assembly factor BamB|nr:PQQ-binding-like beta-propeller repeat protein [Planctomycetaceae bacterium]
MKHLILFFFAVFTPLCFAADSEQWCRFHGPNGQGHSAATGLPTQWSETENIVWKTPLDGKGWSSPVVWNDKVFLTSAQNEGKDCYVFCVHLKDGKILWNKKVFTQEIRMHHPRNSAATSTPATDGKMVYAVFASGRIAALDFSGNIVWTEDLKYYSQHGFASSPIIYKDKFILSVNPSNPPPDGGDMMPPREKLPPEFEPRLGWQLDWDKSYLLALDKTTGKEVWRGQRGASKIGHSTPVIVSVDGKDQIVSPAGSVIQGFDPDSGKLIWTVHSEGEPCVPTAAIGDNCVFSGTAQSAPFRCAKVDGQGDCTRTHTVWEQKRNAPMMASFLYVKPCVYTASDNGSFSAFDEKTGEFLWQKRLGEPLNLSPIYADGKIYVLSELGTTTIFKINADPAKEPEVVATNKIGEQYVQASFAVAGEQLLLRTEKELWCIGK